jgi:hypothetical protein
MREALLNYSPQFVRMLTEKLMTYGWDAAWNISICP